MTQGFGVPELAWLVQTYFSEPSRRKILAEGEVLFEQGARNDRLYLVLKGSFGGFVRSGGEKEYELFEATRNMFVGVQSFFSRTFVSQATIVAREESEVAWIEKNQEAVADGRGRGFCEQFMPVVVANLAWRHRREQELAVEKEEMLRTLVRTEKLASLGQMAAGIAHELNNAIAVLARDAGWLREWLSKFMASRENPSVDYFEQGLLHGRTLSSRETREAARLLSAELSLPEEDAEKAAEMGMSRERLAKDLGMPAARVDLLHDPWEIGAVLHDMDRAAALAAAVVKSVRDLAAPKSNREPGVDINETIREALVLLQSRTREIRIDLRFGELPSITADRSEWVQIWTNLIKNAVESLALSESGDKRIEIESYAGDFLLTGKIRDNGPGIAAENLARIFQPNFTTKEKGLDFGLGLGLTIVEHLVQGYGGTITAESRPGETVMTVRWPRRRET